MKARLILVAGVALALLAAVPLTALAQSGQQTVDGVVVSVITSGTGVLESFKIVNGSGQVIEFRVSGGGGPTQYGLENQAGDRWTSDQAKEPIEAARRLIDHQQRFTPVTVTARDGIALTVVEKEGGKLETNLGYLFAIYTVTWVAFFAYVFYLSRRQSDLQREIVRLKNVLSGKGPGGNRPT